MRRTPWTALAAVAVVEGAYERAARLAGAAAVHIRRVQGDVIHHRLETTFLQPARTRTGAALWNAAAAEGAALTLEEAIAYALEEHTANARGLVSAPRADTDALHEARGR